MSAIRMRWLRVAFIAACLYGGGSARADWTTELEALNRIYDELLTQGTTLDAIDQGIGSIDSVITGNGYGHGGLHDVINLVPDLRAVLYQGGLGTPASGTIQERLQKIASEQFFIKTSAANIEDDVADILGSVDQLEGYTDAVESLLNDIIGELETLTVDVDTSAMESILGVISTKLDTLALINAQMISQTALLTASVNTLATIAVDQRTLLQGISTKITTAQGTLSNIESALAAANTTLTSIETDYLDVYLPQFLTQLDAIRVAVTDITGIDGLAGIKAELVQLNVTAGLIASDTLNMAESLDAIEGALTTDVGVVLDTEVIAEPGTVPLYEEGATTVTERLDADIAGNTTLDSVVWPSGTTASSAPVWSLAVPLAGFMGQAYMADVPIVVDWSFWAPYKALVWPVLICLCAGWGAMHLWEEVRRYG